MFGMFWIPAKAGMTVRGERPSSGTLERPWSAPRTGRSRRSPLPVHEAGGAGGEFRQGERHLALQHAHHAVAGRRMLGLVLAVLRRLPPDGHRGVGVVGRWRFDLRGPVAYRRRKLRFGVGSGGRFTGARWLLRGRFTVRPAGALRRGGWSGRWRRLFPVAGRSALLRSW